MTYNMAEEQTEKLKVFAVLTREEMTSLFIFYCAHK